MKVAGRVLAWLLALAPPTVLAWERLVVRDVLTSHWVYGFLVSALGLAFALRTPRTGGLRLLPFTLIGALLLCVGPRIGIGLVMPTPGTYRSSHAPPGKEVIEFDENRRRLTVQGDAGGYYTSVGSRGVRRVLEPGGGTKPPPFARLARRRSRGRLRRHQHGWPCAPAGRVALASPPRDEPPRDLGRWRSKRLRTGRGALTWGRASRSGERPGC
jgi:hypothetical protein